MVERDAIELVRERCLGGVGNMKTFSPDGDRGGGVGMCARPPLCGGRSLLASLESASPRAARLADDCC